jgi:precorrin-2 dehydrogenase/sirohydrochlorin ferrochelatase
MVTGRKPLKYYPIFLDIRGKKCVIIGGGEVAARKAERLIDCGADVFIISPRLSSELAELEKKDLICHIAAEYTDYFINDAALVIGATDNEETNTRISNDARAKGVLVNIVDDPKRCDFILPALVKRGDLAIAIGTSGKSPALARHLREDLEVRYGKEYEILLNILGNLRVKMGKNAGVGRDWFISLMAEGILDSIKAKDIKKVKKIVKEVTGEEVQVEFN